MIDRPIPVVPDIGTAKAARLAAEVTGNPGHWVRLDCQHTRHVQQPVAAGRLLECPTCPPSPAGALARRHVLRQVPERRLVARLAAEPLAPSTARRLAAQAVAAAMPQVLVGEVEQVAGELVASAIRHTHAPVELTVETHDNVVRIEVRDERSSFPLGPRQDPGGQGGAGLQTVMDLADRWGAGSLAGNGKVVWAELRGPDAG